MKRETLFAAVFEKYQVEPDYPWEKFKDYAVLRHRYKRKWFGVVLSISAAKLGLDSDRVVDILNVKVMPGAVGSLRMQPGILPAYHMNKEHWITLLLDTVPEEEILGLIDESFGLTR
ncbi:MmcQ/YjbR family DNA-binding protein [Cedecea sp.]|jgi:predicted DNA-binding protein (MmcQ/YjbR family)|uniref:MmcQ/YjbR family DNA-binding protein n=1 Tax=Cedecea sp. TaxID=1970739 RepID=UPI0012AE72EA|nr:MmcQ protein [Enterobacteriaceae bacterium RIT693]